MKKARLKRRAAKMEKLRKLERYREKESTTRRGSSRSERKREKERRKAGESLEEKLKRRREKKERKAASHFGYTNEDNPFGDSNLHAQFVWKKKERRLIETGEREIPETKAEARARKQALLAEIERVKARRKDREEEEEEQERLKQEEISLREAEMYGDWEKKEEEFHVTQARRRSKLRIAHGREKPIDVIAKNILLLLKEENSVANKEAIHGDEWMDDMAGANAGALDVELREPYELFVGLPVLELEELSNEIKTYQDMMKDNEFATFWKHMGVVCRDELERARREDVVASGGTAATAALRQRRLRESVQDDLRAELADCEVDELEALRGKVKLQVSRAASEAEAGADQTYWQEAMRQVIVQLSIAHLRDMHLNILERRLAALEKRFEAAQQAAAEEAMARGDSVRATKPTTLPPAVDGSTETGSFSPVLVPDEAANDGSFSPTLDPLPEGDSGVPAEIVDEDEDMRRLEEQRQRVIARSGQSGGAADSRQHIDRSETARNAAETDRRGEVEDGEELMAADDEVALTRSDVYLWQDKYRPRKPRYFNRVKTGYDWNKYNQAHYDHNNPPPKTVQGYKFNVFYPDLIDKSKAPEFYVEPADTPDFCILRFHAGPPYEDVAFKIVNREWEFSRKRGFRSVFDRGVLQLHFNFKRYRYRR